jgi:hypothetical protein
MDTAAWLPHAKVSSGSQRWRLRGGVRLLAAALGSLLLDLNRG